MKKLTNLLSIILCLAFAVGIGGSAAVQATEAEGAIKDSLSVALYDSPTNVFPLHDTSIPCIAVSVNIYDNLFYFNLKTKKIEPTLAEKYEREDDLTYRIFLRKGIKFHNGEEMKATDVLFSIQELVKAGTRSHSTKYYDIDHFAVVNDYEIVMKTTQPYANFIKSLADKAVVIFSQKWFESSDNVDNTACGTGPYSLVSFEASNRAILKRFDDFWGEPAVTENLVIRFIEEVNSRVLELETYGVDIITNVSSLMYDQIKSTDHLKLHETDSVSVAFLAPNYQKKLYADINVRKAIAHSFDAYVIAATLMGNTAVGASNPYLNSNATGYIELERYEYNPELSKKLLAEAGYKDGIKIKLQFAANPEIGRFAEAVQAQMSAANIQAEVEPIESAMWGPLQRKMEQEITYKAWTNTTDDPVRILGVSYSKAIGPGGNSTNYQNPKVDELLDQALQEFDEEKRLEICAQIQHIMHEDYNWLPLFTQKVVFASHDRVRDFELIEPAFYQRYDKTYVLK